MRNQPIKRSKSLMMLSKEHHYGLLTSWKIRRGIALKTEPKRIADFVINFWESHLNAHFIAEEEILFNTTNHILIDIALEQHSKLRILINTISEEGNLT